MRIHSVSWVCVLLALSTATLAQEPSGLRPDAARDCSRDAVDAHVRAQFAEYGPLSTTREYFGFIFLFKGQIASAITRGRSCKNSCGVDTAAAAAQIPPGAKPIGEWHTHPHMSGAGTLSAEDVLGAYNNRRIRCYAPYYSQPNGNIYAWDPQQSLVRKAMTSRSFVGNYLAERRLDAARSDSDD